MISIIICSANAALLNNVKENIYRTIGVPCEILGYDNSIAQKSICEVYNQGVRDANYNILCFMHEDIMMETPAWGVEVSSIFTNNPRTGLLGIAGSSYKSLSPSPWYGSTRSERINYLNVRQKFKYSVKGDQLKYNNPNTLSLSKVSVVDGVWFCGKKEIMLKYPFDDDLLKKFHGYDIDISLLIGQYFDICVSFNILLTHFSEGNFAKEWIEETLLVQEKWKSILPVNKAGLAVWEMRMYERFAFKSFINIMKKSGYSSYSCIKVLNNSWVLKKFGWLLYTRLYIKCLSA